jgi:hypothetical protein
MYQFIDRHVEQKHYVCDDCIEELKDAYGYDGGTDNPLAREIICKAKDKVDEKSNSD